MSMPLPPSSTRYSRGVEMRDLSSLSHEEALTIVAKAMAIVYLDETADGCFLNPDRELTGADVVDDLLSILAAHDLRPESTCSAEILGPYLLR
jgi:hypothetical protein